MKDPQCAWSIRRDVGHDLRMLETFSCRCYGAPLPKRMVLESARACLFMSFPYFCTERLARNDIRVVINMSAEWCKRLYFCQITLFLVFFSFAWAHDIWLINDYFTPVDKFSSWLCNLEH